MSEIARLREQIELECEAAKQGLDGLAVVASHDSINARMGKLWDYRQELAQEVGEQEAVTVNSFSIWRNLEAWCTLDQRNLIPKPRIAEAIKGEGSAYGSKLGEQHRWHGIHAR